MRALRCSFCGRDEQHVAKLVAGPSVFICDRCVTEAARLMNEPPPNDNVPQSQALRRASGLRLLEKWRRLLIGRRHLERETASA